MELAQQLNLPVTTELEIKILDQPDNMVNIKEKVLKFLKVPNEEEHSIDIIDVDYALICGKSEFVTIQEPSKPPVTTQLTSIEELKK